MRTHTRNRTLELIDDLNGFIRDLGGLADEQQAMVALAVILQLRRIIRQLRQMGEKRTLVDS